MNEEDKFSDEVKTENKVKKKTIFSDLYAKIKKIKNLDKILVILFIAIILLIYFSSFSFESFDKKNNTNEVQKESAQSLTFSLQEYQMSLEKKLTQTLKSIKNAGNVSVMIYFDKGIETVIAYTTEIQTNSNGVKIETKSPVLLNTKDGKTQTVVLQEIMPNPSSIVIVATGASDTKVKLEILRAVQAMFNNSNGCIIEIFAGN